jgi:hypothetical protein
MRTQVKDISRNWIDLNIVVAQSTCYVWMNFPWLLGLSYWFCNTLWISNYSELIYVQIYLDWLGYGCRF